MTDLNTELSECINKHLPAELGSTLRKRLNDMERLERDHQNLQESYEQQSKEVKELLSLKMDEAWVKNKIDELTEKETELDKKMLEYQIRAEMLDRNRSDLFTLVNPKLTARTKRQRSESSTDLCYALLVG
jgi:GTPase involved in cell partitioning and DNA repair